MSINFKRSTLILASCFFFSAVQATQITIVNKDAAGEGLNDTTAVAPVTGNPGTTKGEQAMNVFKAAANYWEARLHSPVEIIVTMKFAQLNCTQNSAVLGSAGATGYSRDFPNAPVPNTWFSRALKHAYIGTSQNLADIDARFNGGIGQPGCLESKSWSYVIDDNAPEAGKAKLYQTAIHEIGHGLGFATLVDKNTGALANGINDIYMTFLQDNTQNKNWTDMTDTERSASAVNTDNVIWTGVKAVAEASSLTAGTISSKPTMYTPNPVQGGSSLSHWNTTLTPDEIMEPSLTATSKTQLTTQAFYDMHWIDPCRVTKDLAPNQWAQISLPCVAPATANTLSDILGDDMNGAYDTDWVVYGYNPATNAYVKIGLSDIMETGKGYWIIQETGSSTVTLEMPLNSVGADTVVATQCQSTNDCFEVDLATSANTYQWQMLGTPFRNNVKVEDIRFYSNTGSSTCNSTEGCTLSTAQTDSLAENNLWSYNGTAYVDLLSGANTEITPWTGAWFATSSGANGSDAELFIPKPEAEFAFAPQ